MATYSPESLGIKATTTGGQFKQGAHYAGRQYWNGTLGEVGQLHPESDQIGAGKPISTEVISQTNPANVSFIDRQIKASQIQSPQEVMSLASGPSSTSLFTQGLTGQVDTYRKELETTLAARKTEVDTKLASLREKEKQTLEKVGELSTPFREELENTERDRLKINENYEANQTLINELDSLLTEGNNLIKQQQEVTGLAAVRNPRIQKAMDDVAARAGVIQAVISARNGQIAQGQNMIDRSVSAIAADRKDQISYYETILNLNNRDIMSLEDDDRKLAEEQLALKKGDLERAQATSDYVKQLLLNPTTAGLMGEAGVKLTDSVEEINLKLSQATYIKEVNDMNNAMGKDGYSAVIDPKSVPAGRLVTLTDSKGKKYYFEKLGTTDGLGTAREWIQKELAKSTISTTGTDKVQVSDVARQTVQTLIDEVVAPNVSPSAGIGSLYVDSLGRKWIYEKTGWRLLE